MMVHIEPPYGSRLLWKYMDLHKFIYLITTKNLFFTRLDKFNDPFEGVATKILRREAKYSKVPKDLDSFPENIQVEERKQLLNEKRLHDAVKADEIRVSQMSQYVNCWCSGNRESMAMWSIYSNSDSVAIRGTFSKISSELEGSFHKEVINNERRIKIIGSAVTYLKLNPFDESLGKQKLRYSALKKDVSFQYENEYRFLIHTIDRLDKQPQYFEIPIEIDSLNLSVICHPNMEDWKFNNIVQLINLSNLKMKIRKSATLLKQSFG